MEEGHKIPAAILIALVRKGKQLLPSNPDLAKSYFEVALHEGGLPDDMVTGVESDIAAIAETQGKRLLLELKKKEDEFQAKMQQLQTMVVSRVEVVQKNESNELMGLVNTAGEQVKKNRTELEVQLSKTEEAKEKLQASEKKLAQEVDRMKKYIEIVETQGMLPETVQFYELLKSCKRIAKKRPTQVKCFVSYAWPPKDDPSRELLQARYQNIQRFHVY